MSALPRPQDDAAATACFLCGRRDLTVLTTELRHGPGRVLHCPDCALGILERADATGADLRAYYDGEYRKHHGPTPGRPADYRDIFEAHVDYQQQRLAMLAPYLHGDARVLEIGCSTGHLLCHLHERAGEAVGFDLDSGAAAFARDELGLTTHSGTLAGSGLPRNAFDLVIAIQTLEHIDDPIAACRTFAGYVRPGGTLVVEVPNLDDPLLSLYDVPRYRRFYYHKAHLWYFSAASLAAVMARAGIDGEVTYAQDYNLLNHLHWVLRDEPQPSAHAGLGPARLPLADDLPADLRSELAVFAADMDRRYKAILCRHGRGENLWFAGTPAGGGTP